MKNLQKAVQNKKKVDKMDKKGKGSLAISQILILIVGIIAISYAIGSSVGEVSGQGTSFKYETQTSDWKTLEVKTYTVGQEDGTIIVKSDSGDIIRKDNTGFYLDKNNNEKKDPGEDYFHPCFYDLVYGNSESKYCVGSETEGAYKQKAPEEEIPEEESETDYWATKDTQRGPSKEIETETEQSSDDSSTSLPAAFTTAYSTYQAFESAVGKLKGIGDAGETSLICGEDIPPSDPRCQGKEPGSEATPAGKTDAGNIAKAVGGDLVAQTFDVGNVIGNPEKTLADAISTEKLPGDKTEYFFKDGSSVILDKNNKVTQIDTGLPVKGTIAGSALENWFNANSAVANSVGHIIDGAVIAGGMLIFRKEIKDLLGGIFGEEGEGWARGLSVALPVAVFGVETTVGLLKKGGLIGGTTGTTAGGWAIGLGITAVVTVVTFLAHYKTYDQKTVVFECLPWQPDTGGADCDKCNQQGILPCSEYQCRSLGQGCELLNDEESGEAVCVYVSRDDSEYPTIEAWEDVLTSGYEYSPDNAISPPDRGVKIINPESSDGCIPAFTALNFGIELNEPAQCKIDTTRKQSYEEMSFTMSSGLFKEEHIYSLSLPSPSSLEAEGIETEVGGEQNLYVRCQDANGNSNPATFIFKFCIEEGADTTPPLIVSTDLLNNMPIAYNQSTINLNLYVNEPAECSWSRNDQAYENMENKMGCSLADSVNDMNAQGLYTCTTTLTGIKDGLNNKFYFRCKDQPSAEESNRNTNVESYEFTIKGTQPLAITSLSPNGTTIKDSTTDVKVTLEAETSAGYNKGEATCYYKESDEAESAYSMFLETGSYQHSHELWLKTGEHSYDIKCVDLGGNSDYGEITFEVETDTNPPVVVRAYHEDTYLKIITDEKAECVYDFVDCNYAFDDGLSMTTTNDVNHFTEWKTNRNFYIKCRDEYGREPRPDECSIIAKPFQI